MRVADQAHYRGVKSSEGVHGRREGRIQTADIAADEVARNAVADYGRISIRAASVAPVSRTHVLTITPFVLAIRRPYPGTTLYRTLVEHIARKFNEAVLLSDMLTQ